jgi:hypothetical protein
MALKIEIRGSNGKLLKTVGFEGTREDAAKAAIDNIGHNNAEMAIIKDDKDDLVAIVQFKL